MSELSFSQSFGFLEHGHDMDDMMKNLARNFKYCAIVRRAFITSLDLI